MSKYKSFLPGTYTVGEHPVVGPDPDHDDANGPAPTIHIEGHREPLKTAAGQPITKREGEKEKLYTGAKLLGMQSHFKNEAAKRRANGDLRKAVPSDLVLVPILKGLGCEYATHLRGEMKRRALRSLASTSSLVGGGVTDFSASFETAPTMQGSSLLGAS